MCRVQLFHLKCVVLAKCVIKKNAVTCEMRLCSCSDLDHPDAKDPNTTTVIAVKSSSLHCDPPPSAYKSSIRLSLWSWDTLQTNTLKKTHCFSLYLSSSLHCGCVANERQDAVYFTTGIAEPNPKEEQLWSKQCWKMRLVWKGRKEHLVFQNVHEGSLRAGDFVRTYWKECSLLLRTEEESGLGVSGLPFTESHNTQG